MPRLDMAAETGLLIGCFLAAMAVKFVFSFVAPDAFPDGENLGIGLGNVGATAILGWYAWHTTTKTIPSLVHNFREEMREQRAAHREDIKILRMRDEEK